MLSARLTEPRWAIFSQDVALRNASPDDLRDYLNTRNIAVFKDIDSWPVQPTKFLMRPMLAVYQGLYPNNIPTIFQLMVEDIQNGPVSITDFELVPGDMSGQKRLSDSATNELPLDAIVEMGKFSYDMASADGVTSPFIWEGGTLVKHREGLLKLDATNVRLAMTADETNSES